MKKVLIVVLAGLFLATFAYAGDDVVPAVKTGSKSLNFTFGGLGVFNLNATGPNAGLGLSYFLSSDAAVRAGLQLGLATTSTPAPGTGGTDGSTSGFSVGLSADYLMFMNAGRVRPYYGAGFQFLTSTSDVKTAVAQGGTQVETKGGTPTTFGLAGFMGAEFFIYPELSLSAEYSLTLISLTSHSDLVSTSGVTSTTVKQGSSLNVLGFNAAGATLHIYF